MGVFRILDISNSALSAERLRLEVHLTNLANARTTRTPEGGPYRRREVIFESRPAGNFADVLRQVTARVVMDPAEDFQLVFDPGHPDADAEGYVALPNVDPIREQADIVSAARGYEANLAVLRVSKDLLSRALKLGQ